MGVRNDIVFWTGGEGNRAGVCEGRNKKQTEKDAGSIQFRSRKMIAKMIYKFFGKYDTLMSYYACYSSPIN